MSPGGSAHSVGASRFAGLGRGISGNGCCKSSASITSAVMTAGIASCASASADARAVHGANRLVVEGGTGSTAAVVGGGGGPGNKRP